jgi:hypothetical protein
VKAERSPAGKENCISWFRTYQNAAIPAVLSQKYSSQQVHQEFHLHLQRERKQFPLAPRACANPATHQVRAEENLRALRHHYCAYIRCLEYAECCSREKLCNFSEFVAESKIWFI